MNLSQMRYYKQLKGYSLDQLAELSGVPRGTLQKIFSGETKSPRYETLQALEAVLKPGDGEILDTSYDETEPAASMVREPALCYDGVQRRYTLEDYYALPEERRVELIDGVFYDMSAPTTLHQIVSGDIYSELKNYIRRKKGECIPFMAPTDVQLDCDDSTMVQPDVMVLCDRRKLIKRCIFGAPDFIVEILSPSTRRKDLITKAAKYSGAGVREYWIVDVEKQRTLVYHFEEDEFPALYGADADIPVGIYQGELTISLKDTFESIRGIE